MKQNFYSCFILFLIVFLLTSSQMSARLLSVKQGEGEVKLNDAASGDSLLEIENNDSLNNLMWLEECENGDKDCSERRVLAEAHLDYIYTQHHKP